MRRTLAILLLAAPAIAAPVPKESKATDEAKILGTWEMVRYVCYGQEQALTRPVSWRLEADGRGTLTNANGPSPLSYKLLPPETAESDKGIDYNWSDYRFKGLYKVDRDTLIMAVDTGGGKVRATELGPIKEVWYWEFKRVASEK